MRKKANGWNRMEKTICQSFMSLSGLVKTCATSLRIMILKEPRLCQDRYFHKACWERMSEILLQEDHLQLFHAWRKIYPLRIIVLISFIILVDVISLPWEMLRVARQGLRFWFQMRRRIMWTSNIRKPPARTILKDATVDLGEIEAAVQWSQRRVEIPLGW